MGGLSYLDFLRKPRRAGNRDGGCLYFLLIPYLFGKTKHPFEKRRDGIAVVSHSNGEAGPKIENSNLL
jgi:hypothetical protein